MCNIGICLITLPDILMPIYYWAHLNANCHEMTLIMQLLVISVNYHTPQNRISDTIITHVTLNTMSCVVHGNFSLKCLKVWHAWLSRGSDSGSPRSGCVFPFLVLKSFMSTGIMSLRKRKRESFKPIVELFYFILFFFLLNGKT